jgi:DNA repair protein RecN (Recombination protein N)
MLRELHISNLAVIADARIELDPGLNCFTGATGAGKSLVIGAVEVLLGFRNPGEMLRPGVPEGRVTGLFEVNDPQLLQMIATLTDIPVTSDGGELLLTRKLYSSGRTSVTLNGSPITLGMLKQVAEGMVDIHGQHDHQYLLKPSNQLEMLDQFADLQSLRERYHEVFRKLSEARKRIEDLSVSRTLRTQRLELYRFQADEIDSAELDAAEYAELEARSSVLQNLEKLKKEAGAAHVALYEADGSILERLKMVAAILGDLSNLDASLKPIADGARDATLRLEDSAYDLSRYLDRLDLDPSELTEVTERLNVINRILNKYGNTIDQTIAYRQQIGADIAELEKASDDLAALTVQIQPLRKQLKQLGEELTAKRQTAGGKLSKLIEKSLGELGMEKAVFSVSIAPAASTMPGEDLPATATGFDQIEFIIQTNPGQLAQPLRKIASGGELSRIMLALKGILAKSDRVSVLVFDEIDANVGGRLGAVIGSKLRSLADHHQVLCITHLPQIASYADRHLTVRKEVSGTETATKVSTLEGEARVEELAEMIGGHHITATTRAQAKELLEAAAEQISNRAKPPAKSSKSNGAVEQPAEKSALQKPSPAKSPEEKRSPAKPPTNPKKKSTRV